jgi:hypothetical protein
MILDFGLSKKYSEINITIVHDKITDKKNFMITVTLSINFEIVFIGQTSEKKLVQLM